MSDVTPATLLSHLQWRYATKRFDPARTINPETWTVLEQALVLAPSSFGLQPWRFIIVTDRAVRAKLLAASWNQSQVMDCSHHVVFTARETVESADVERFVARQIEVRNDSPESLAAYKGMMLGFVNNPQPGFDRHHWASLQTYIALGQFMTAAAMLSVDTCPMEGIDRAAYDEILALKGTGYRTVVACAAGYRAAADKYATAAKVRFPLEQVIRHI
ncbi:MAG: NAD(P)H-dependent oxidoreductase [Phycisphaerales bacterium]